MERKLGDAKNSRLGCERVVRIRVRESFTQVDPCGGTETDVES